MFAMSFTQIAAWFFVALLGIGIVIDLIRRIN